MIEHDETLDSLETWIARYATASRNGELSVIDVVTAYTHATGEAPDIDEVYILLSERFIATRDESGSLIFRAILDI
jgi:hypothetical protein